MIYPFCMKFSHPIIKNIPFYRHTPNSPTQTAQRYYTADPPLPPLPLTLLQRGPVLHGSDPRTRQPPTSTILSLYRGGNEGRSRCNRGSRSVGGCRWLDVEVGLRRRKTTGRCRCRCRQGSVLVHPREGWRQRVLGSLVLPAADGGRRDREDVLASPCAGTALNA